MVELDTPRGAVHHPNGRRGAKQNFLLRRQGTGAPKNNKEEKEKRARQGTTSAQHGQNKAKSRAPVTAQRSTGNRLPVSCHSVGWP